jgi:hypothetical protein
VYVALDCDGWAWSCSSLAHAEGSGQEFYDLQDRKSVLPDSKMPKLKHTDDELKALIDFPLSLK